jgi:hypothetical protein
VLHFRPLCRFRNFYTELAHTAMAHTTSTKSGDVVKGLLAGLVAGGVAIVVLLLVATAINRPLDLVSVMIAALVVVSAAVLTGRRAGATRQEQ